MIIKRGFLITLLTLGLGVSTVLSQHIDWVDLELAQKHAKAENKKVLLFMEAEWCGYCKKMYREVFPKQSVQDSLHKYFYPVRIDLESKEQVVFNGSKISQQDLGRQFRVTGTPTLIFLESDGSVMGTQPGFIPAKIFDKLMAFVGSEEFQDMGFKEYLAKFDIDP